ncbi:nicotinate-nucleotide adenylyltransferase [Bianquea renquensis]|jgi:nicotinate-nucleotide adenylyltransferase|uniref:Probable nicotinate-nucleotide adenylyltransferase n=1 Tax=Bianquea renquensis TaxID=2763661 RepID=A0A926DSY6_9FIRM|nr:nicotinate-nucleotide adenylyltransferase [Bianquea renquensis]MBC8543189.1 nicotinate-nucleotide adenylyltransferase [Bianquea renquensis]
MHTYRESGAAYTSFYFSKPLKIAVMGGTFDPIHYGHLVTAEAVRHQYDIGQVLFVPTGHPPHKKQSEVTHPEDRYLMTMLATETNPAFYVSRIEIERTGFTYTVDTIEELKGIYPANTEIFFITGADAFHEILTWKNAEHLLSSCTFVAATRPGYHRKELSERVEKLGKDFGDHLHFLEVPALSISSSDIRQRVREDRPIKYLLPESVENYIYKHALYGRTSAT